MRILAILSIASVLTVATAAIAGPPSGALHTTDVNGAAVNANHFATKPDVFISGGPNSNAGPMLDAGEYYFMVTDPAGKVLLSQDGIGARRLTIDAQGLIVASTHVTGTDADDGDLTVQLFPFADTPNNGGVYKVWITPVARFQAGQGTFGFLPKYSKTDTFKVLQPGTPDCGCGCDCGR